MHLISYLRQYLPGSPASSTSITATDIAKAYGTLRCPSFTADIIFSESQTKLYQSYISHLGKKPVETLSIYAPTPYEHNGFLLWQSPIPSAAHKPCQHLRHPSNKLKMFHKHCPECMWKIYASYLNLIAERWREQGGPARSAWTKRASPKLDQFLTLKKAWYYARLTMANLERLFELMVMQEQAWENRHARRVDADTKSAKKALETAQRTTLSSQDASPRPLSHGTSVGVVPASKNKKTRKTVAFTQDTKNTAGGRRKETYQRTHKTYRSGRYACPFVSGWLNTSAQNEWRSSIAQCKLFIVEKSEDMAVDRPALRMRQGFVSDYQYRKEVMKFLKSRLEDDVFVTREQYLKMLNRCDGVVVLRPRVAKELGTDGVVLKDVRLLFLETDNPLVKRSNFSGEIPG